MDLKNLVASYDGVSGLVNKGIEIDIIYMYVYKALDTVLHGILVSKLERHGVDGQSTWWIRN